MATFTVSAIASALEISKPYATDIRAGKRVPHRRHGRALARPLAVNLLGIVSVGEDLGCQFPSEASSESHSHHVGAREKALLASWRSPSPNNPSLDLILLVIVSTVLVLSY